VPLDQAVAGCRGNTRACKELEGRLVEILKAQVSRVAREYLCRQLSLIGSAASVPALAELLLDPGLSHLARFALERLACPEALRALQNSLPRLQGLNKVGVILSLGLCRAASSLPVLRGAADSEDLQVAAAAIAALGEIGTTEASLALQKLRVKAPKALRPLVADACLTCAEHLCAEGKKAEALRVYKSLSSPEQAKHVRLAAMRGQLQVAGGK
jgi:hypothetical protein